MERFGGSKQALDVRMHRLNRRPTMEEICRQFVFGENTTLRNHLEKLIDQNVMRNAILLLC